MTEARKTAVVLLYFAAAVVFDFLYWLGFLRDET
jgi:hypothetical protein